MDEVLCRRLHALTGSAPIAWRRVERGYTPAQRWVVRFADGSSAFAKLGVSPLTASCLRDELRNYQRLNAPFMPRLPPIADAPRVRWIQLEQLRIALPWAARALGCRYQVRRPARLSLGGVGARYVQAQTLLKALRAHSAVHANCVESLTIPAWCLHSAKG